MPIALGSHVLSGKHVNDTYRIHQISHSGGFLQPAIQKRNSAHITNEK